MLMDQLLRCNKSLDLRDIVSVNREVDPISLYARIEYSTVDFVLVHCQSYQCYGVIKKVIYDVHFVICPPLLAFVQLFYLRNEETLEESSVPWLMTEALTQNVSAVSYCAYTCEVFLCLHA